MDGAILLWGVLALVLGLSGLVAVGIVRRGRGQAARKSAYRAAIIVAVTVLAIGALLTVWFVVGAAIMEHDIAA